MKKVKSQSGFTLLELIVVIAIIAVLSAFLIVAINPLTQIKKGRDARRKADVRLIQSALELYRADNNAYPSSIPGCNSAFVGTGVIYMPKIPCDPKTGSSYGYSFVSPGYTLCAGIENASDPDPLIVSGGACAPKSYVVTNP